MQFPAEWLGVPVNTLAGSAAILLLVAAADALLRWIVRRKVRRDRRAATAAASTAAERERLEWLDQALMASVPPLEVLIWVVGAAAALSPLLPIVTPPSLAPAAVILLTWSRDLGAMAALFWLLVRLSRVADAALTSLAGRTANAWDDALLPLAGKAARVLLPILALILGVQTLSIPADWQGVLGTALSLVLIGAMAFLLYLCIDATESLVLQRYRVDARDNLEARTIYTQITVLKKIAVTVVVIFTIGSMLMVFESVRQFGTSILASAGIAGIIIGFAAQRSIATLLAGFQIAITQPIRLDDVVIVENEWGRIEDITLTYVTVRIWDQRRLIVPITYFLEQPFQNWTRTSADILGTVFLYVDYSAPLDAIRAELDRILSESPHWDGRVKVLQATEAREHTLQIRALASAADASLAWDLRCEIREKLVQFLQRQHPDSLPRMRAELAARGGSPGEHRER
ncbi:MAG TPA: mechanosensitive ion channel domain-containing protein [Vicinamibacterales bacterium]|nr:mechanosensitive ion channel domain-containing protein [Vicinamibacterales bacterium]